MQLVVSPHLEPEDIEALQSALELPATVLQTIAAKCLADVEDALVHDRLNALAWLAASGRLEIRLALRINDQGQIKKGLYHEKVGIFTDEQHFHVPL